MKQIVSKISLALIFTAIVAGLASCTKEDEKLKELTLAFEQETYVIGQGQSIEIPFTVGNVSGAVLTQEVRSDNAEYPATVSEIAKGKGTVTVTAPQYVFSPVTLTVTLTVNDEVNKRTATAAVTVNFETDEASTKLTLASEQETYVIEQGQSIEIPFTVGNICDAALTQEVQSDNAEYPAAVSEIVDGKATVTVTAPQYIFSPETFTVTLTVNDEANKRTATVAVTVTSKIDDAYTEITEAANCYVVVPGAMVKFPANIGNSAEKAAFESASLVWQDKKGIVSEIIAQPEQGTVVAVLNPEIDGNALIAVKNAADEIVWSYHLWITAADPAGASAKVLAYTDTTTNITYELMDRYIGATSDQPGSDASNGLFYQWGRKDPFAASTYNNELKELFDMAGDTVVRVVTPVEEANNIATSVKNPTTYYSGVSGGNYSWITTNKGELTAADIEDLWGGVSGSKTQYDPCPAGWRVAPIAAWKFYNDESMTVEKVFTGGVEENKSLQGRIYNGIWFPSQGEIPHGGKFTNGIGSTWPNGKAWSAGIDSANYRAWASSSTPTSVNWYGGMGFGYALPVRCVRTSAN